MPTSTNPPSTSPVPRSGILTTPTGDRHIPPSTRADGSLRKEIKIRPGYRPPEDVEVYKNRTAEAWKTRGTGGIPGAASVHDGGADDGKAAAGKNAKRREARRKAKTAEGEGDGDLRDPKEVSKNEEQSQSTRTSNPVAKDNWRSEETRALELAEEPDLEAEKEKQARNLKKKLRQARELKEKNDSGESLLPEQFAKVIKIQELIRQLDGMGFDSDGVKKAKDIR